MSSVQEIEKAIDTLSAPELEELLEWVDQRPHPLDARLQANLEAGHFDSAIDQALQDEASGRLRPL